MAQSEPLELLLKKLDFVISGTNSRQDAPSSPIVCYLPTGMPVTMDDFNWQTNIYGSPQNLFRAAMFAKYCDLIPDVAKKIYRISGHEWNTSQLFLSDVYKEILTPGMVRLPEVKKNPALEEKLKKWNEKLVVKKKTKDLITDEEKEVEEPSHLVLQYKKSQRTYEDALLDYNSRLSNMLSSTNPTVISDFSLNGPMLQKRIKAAWDEWTSVGYKNQLEELYAAIENATQATPEAAWSQYREKLRHAERDSGAGFMFYPTYFFPTEFANAHWAKFSWESSVTDTHTKDLSHSFHWSGRAGWGPISANASRQNETVDHDMNSNVQVSKVYLEIASVQLIRPWLAPEILKSRKWAWQQGTHRTATKDLVSNGSTTDPKGSLPAYSTEMVVVRNVKITLSGHVEKLKKRFSHDKFEAGASYGFGPFTVGGNYGFETTKDEKTHNINVTNNVLELPMQIIAFKVQPVPLMPNPDFLKK